ncbi:MAG: lipopolysaccharide biosynthesis protein [bacterium]|nr:lipopolysaccharide biosynthesis protein [bacterium]
MAAPAPSLRRNFTWTFLGNAVFAASQWGILVVLTKLGSAAEVGRLSLASTVATPLVVFANLQLRSVFVSDAHGRFPFRDYLGVQLLLAPLALAAVVVTGTVCYSGPQVTAIVLYGIGRVIDGVGDVLYGLEQKRERMDLMARSLMIRGAVSLVLFAVVYRLTGSLNAALVAWPVAWAVPLLVFDLPRCRALVRDAAGEEGSLRPRWRPGALRAIIWTALPLGVVMLLIQLRNTVPRTMLESAQGEEALGIFSAMAYLVLVSNTVVMALSQSSIARLARNHADGDARAFRSTVGKLMAVGVVLGLAGVAVARWWGGPLLTLVYGAEYAVRGDLFVLIMAGGGIMNLGSLLGAPATAMQAFRSQLVIHALNAGLLVAMGRWLIPAHGMAGAAWTVLAGSAWVTLAYGAVVLRGMARMRVGVPAAAKGGAA